MSFNLRCIAPSSSCLVFCLRTSKSLSMGEFDESHICIGLVRYLGVILGVLMNIYTIYAPFLLLCVFCLCLSVFTDFWFTSLITCN